MDNLELTDNSSIAQSVVEHPSSASTVTSTPAFKPEFTDSRVFRYIKEFLRAPKPKGMGPFENMYIVALLTAKAIDHEIEHSHETIAAWMGCDEKTVERVERRLQNRGIVSATSRTGYSKLTALNLSKLPMADPALPRKPSAEASELTRWYITKRMRQGLRSPYKKQFENMDWNAEKLLRLCDGDGDLVRRVIDFAWDHTQFKKAARTGLLVLRKRWRKIENAFTAATLAAMTPKPDSSAVPAPAQSFDVPDDLFIEQ